MMLSLRVTVTLASLHIAAVQSFQSPTTHYVNRRNLVRTIQPSSMKCSHKAPRHIAALFAEIGEMELKTELAEYLKKRVELNADEAAKA